ncbi:TlpA disulfide reductase family protein [Pedobacter sp. L105]|uniref:TlpA disulfide reductase family protein n=1 Tax=Pedobacter sp. L105 TaxID=1641871 RepID=UPI00131E9340|nr:TlpA disulfide reductase family protein [Pedobacter sp. L105]
MYKKSWILSVLTLFTLYAAAATPPLQQGNWRAALLREDGQKIIFNIDIQQQKGKTVWYVVNGEEKMLVNDLTVVKDSLFINMPVFESSFRVKIISKDSLAGVWIKRGPTKDNVMPFSATTKEQYRFSPVNGDASQQAAGKWKIDFIRGSNHEPALGNFSQNGNVVTGSILTPSGDYRFLSGTVTGDLLQLSTFDGVHAMLFTAKINKDSLTDASLYSSRAPVQQWVGVKDANAPVPEGEITKVKDGESGKLDFSFNDLDGKQVSINDARYKNKVVIIQLMGSWCPNCMDEMAFLSEYYKHNKQRGVEIIALAYEYTTDVQRSTLSLRKFQKKFDVTYPMLITPTTVGDPLRTEKSLPQLTSIKVFPTSLILDKSGKVVAVHTDFYGPGTGEYYTQYVQNFEKTINELLKK